jgi:2-keto-4-pentenoate hydratase/2-oxohepta-3-ene-1,7-dioic acid hydratase in catechol pathway
MKIVIFGPERRVGALDGERVIDLNKADPRIPARLDAFIEGGKATLDHAQTAIAKASGDAVLKASAVKLLAPWPGRRLAMVGGNYADHLAGMNANLGRGGPTTIEGATKAARESGHWGFWKVPVEVASATDDVPFPRYAKYLDYEGEAAIVIGKRGKNIKASEIKDYVWGVTLVNDWSIRDPSSMPAGRPMSYNLAKNFDGSTSLGPCLVAGELDPDNVDVETKVNGQVRQKFNSKDMIFKFGEVLEFLSRDFTFVPGDIISGGTAVGTAADQTKPAPDGSKPLDLFLKVGDVVEVSSPKIGTLKNKLI